MKHLRLLSIALVLVFIGTSCSSGLSFTKRRYSKGFYVHRSGNPTQPSTVRQAPQAVSEVPEVAIVPPAQQPESVQIPQQVPAPAVKENNTDRAVASAATVKTKKNIQKALNLVTKAPFVSLIPEKKIKALRDADLSRGPAGDALSLLWILLVVIAIIYLLGILFNGFGLGNLIHLLGVVLVVLLILWLLKII